MDSGELFSGQEGKPVVEAKEGELLLETSGISDCFSKNTALPSFSFLRGFSGVTKDVAGGFLSKDFNCLTSVTGNVLLLDLSLS